MKIVITSGGFDPLHEGHILYLEQAAPLGDRHMVLVNSDEWLTRKKGKPFMNYHTRGLIIKSLRCVDAVMAAQDEDDTVVESLRWLRQLFPKDDLIFAKGGDRVYGNTPETKFCEEHGIELAWNVGGHKMDSSSEILKRWKDGKI